MARAGEKIYNPVQEDSIGFRQTARDTGGQLTSGEGAGPRSKTSVMAWALTVATSLLVASLCLLGKMRRRKR